MQYGISSNMKVAPKSEKIAVNNKRNSSVATLFWAFSLDKI